MSLKIVVIIVMIWYSKRVAYELGSVEAWLMCLTAIGLCRTWQTTTAMFTWFIGKSFSEIIGVLKLCLQVRVWLVGTWNLMTLLATTI